MKTRYYIPAITSFLAFTAYLLGMHNFHHGILEFSFFTYLIPLIWFLYVAWVIAIIQIIYGIYLYAKFKKGKIKNFKQGKDHIISAFITLIFQLTVMTMLDNGYYITV